MADDEGDADAPLHAASLRTLPTDRRGQDDPPAHALVQPRQANDDAEQLRLEQMRVLQTYAPSIAMATPTDAPKPRRVPINLTAPRMDCGLSRWSRLQETYEQLVSVLPACSLCTAPKKRRNQTLRKIYHDYKNAAARRENKSFTALTHSAPHGCGDGYSECPCKPAASPPSNCSWRQKMLIRRGSREGALCKSSRARSSIVVTTGDACCVKILGHAQRRVALRHAMFCGFMNALRGAPKVCSLSLHAPRWGVLAVGADETPPRP
jgi:hypothetical protein